jgi:hypothetical protein
VLVYDVIPMRPTFDEPKAAIHSALVRSESMSLD